MRELGRDEFRAHMAFLSDDLLEGRGTATRGHELAARYIAAQFEALGLQPAGADGTYYQRVPLLEISVDADRSELTITRNGTQVHLVWGTDFLARGNATNLLRESTALSCSSGTAHSLRTAATTTMQELTSGTRSSRS